MDAGRLADVMRLMRSEMIDTGEVIARRGDAAVAVFIIATGSVDLLAAQGKRVCSPGETVGAHEVLGGTPYAATIRARELTRLLAIDRDDFVELAEKEPSMCAAFERRDAEGSFG
jgi:voltage-gated potassium channel